MNKAELVFIPVPAMGHLMSMLEIAKLLVDRDERLFITVLIINLPYDTGVNTYTQSLSADATVLLRFVYLPQDEPNSEIMLKPPNTVFSALIDSQRTHVRDAVLDITRSNPVRLAGFVVDMFCHNMIDVANEFGLPSYVFFTSTAAFLGLMLHVQTLKDHHNQDFMEYKDSDVELSIPSFTNPVPSKVLPTPMLDEVMFPLVLSTARKLRETKGIMINTFMELEVHAVKSLSDGKNPPVYPVGPMLNLKVSEGIHNLKPDKYDAIMNWLDNQPPSSVVFLCFGSMGSFNRDQVKEIAHALVHSGHRFLWSLRRPAPKGSNIELPGDFTDPDEVLPEGFLQMIAGIGKVIGWAPQVAVLSHPAVGGFVSHCGWNSTLESLWFGVPIATWPMYAEQQINAFQMVKELGLAVEIKMDYRKDFNTDNPVIVTAEEIESGIRQLMMDDGESEIRKVVKEMKEASRRSMMKGGSSYTSLGRFIEDVLDNISEPT